MKGIKSKLGKNQVEDDLDDMVDAILKGDEDLMELVNIFYLIFNLVTIKEVIVWKIS